MIIVLHGTFLGGLIMAYFLRQEKKKKGTYLQMYDSYWDKEKAYLEIFLIFLFSSLGW